MYVCCMIMSKPDAVDTEHFMLHSGVGMECILGKIHSSLRGSSCGKPQVLTSQFLCNLCSQPYFCTYGAIYALIFAFLDRE